MRARHHWIRRGKMMVNSESTNRTTSHPRRWQTGHHNVGSEPRHLDSITAQLVLNGPTSDKLKPRTTA